MPEDKPEEWHYYISSRELTVVELLHHARMEWSVETMHWLLDVHFGEDFCRVEDRNIQQNLNMLRKAALNLIKHHKERAGAKGSCLTVCSILMLFYRFLKIDFRGIA